MKHVVAMTVVILISGCVCSQIKHSLPPAPILPPKITQPESKEYDDSSRLKNAIGDFTPSDNISFSIQSPNGDLWYSPRRLDGKARIYAASHNVGFDFTDTSAHILVYNVSNALMVNISYSSGIGKPFLTIDIDKNGNIVRHVQGTSSICGTGVAEEAEIQ